MGKGRRSSERPLQKVLGKGANVNEDNPLEVHDPKVGSLISYEGVTTANGAGDGSSLIDSVLTTKPDYNGNLVIITSGAYAGQGRDINAATTGGTVTPSSAFGGQILSGVTFVIVALRLTPAEVAAIEAKLDHATHGLAALKALIDAVEAKLDALPGLNIFEGSRAATWNSGTGTSGEAGEDLLGGTSPQGAIPGITLLHSLLLDVDALTDGSKIRVKLFIKIGANGNERKVYDQEFTVPTTTLGETPPPDTLGLWIVNGTVAVHNDLRVEVYSDTDDGVAIGYTYVTGAIHA